jgi:hypothetical protein
VVAVHRQLQEVRHDDVDILLRVQLLLLNFQWRNNACISGFYFSSPPPDHVPLMQGEGSQRKRVPHVHVCPHATCAGASAPFPGAGAIAGRARQSPFPMVSVQEGMSDGFLLFFLFFSKLSFFTVKIILF